MVAAMLMAVREGTNPGEVAPHRDPKRGTTCSTLKIINPHDRLLYTVRTAVRDAFGTESHVTFDVMWDGIDGGRELQIGRFWACDNVDALECNSTLQPKQRLP